MYNIEIHDGNFFVEILTVLFLFFYFVEIFFIGAGPFPGVVDMFGSSGSLMEHRAALFASRGIAALALAYIGFEGLPKDFSNLKMSYFQEAVNYFLSREEVSPLFYYMNIHSIYKNAQYTFCG